MTEGINENLPAGAAELSPDDLMALIPDYITTREDLNEFEKENIQAALNWVRRQRLTCDNVLTVDFCLNLHKRMFDKTWRWAGKFRTREVNIGNTPPHMISTQVKNSLDNVAYWVQNDTFHINEICLRLHREIVWIHPFSNGNGRHSRIFCDILRRALGKQNFTWGNHAGNLASADAHRLEYITALREADRGDYRRLINFATSAR